MVEAWAGGRAFETVPNQDFIAEVTALPGARELLVKVKESGIRVALASSADKANLEIYKRIVEMQELVEKETSANDANRS